MYILYNSDRRPFQIINISWGKIINLRMNYSARRQFQHGVEDAGGGGAISDSKFLPSTWLGSNNKIFPPQHIRL
jgi:hypothetical protein